MKYIYLILFILLLIIFQNNIIHYIKSIFISDDNIADNLEYIYDINIPGNFRIFSYYSHTKINNILNNKLTLSKIYPFNKWLKSKIKNIKYWSNNYIVGNYLGMFCTSKTSILLYSKEFYIDILNEISVWQSEVNHYLERSWYNLYN